jgi:hypothetical protein
MRAAVPQGNTRKTRGRKRSAKERLLLRPRPETGLGEWLAAMVRGLDALDFLERSRELAAEAVVPSSTRRR